MLNKKTLYLLIILIMFSFTSCKKDKNVEEIEGGKLGEIIEEEKNKDKDKDKNKNQDKADLLTKEILSKNQLAKEDVKKLIGSLLVEADKFYGLTYGDSRLPISEEVKEFSEFTEYYPVSKNAPFKNIEDLMNFTYSIFGKNGDYTPKAKWLIESIYPVSDQGFMYVEYNPTLGQKTSKWDLETMKILFNSEDYIVVEADFYDDYLFDLAQRGILVIGKEDGDYKIYCDPFDSNSNWIDIDEETISISLLREKVKKNLEKIGLKGDIDSAYIDIQVDSIHEYKGRKAATANIISKTIDYEKKTYYVSKEKFIYIDIAQGDILDAIDVVENKGGSLLNPEFTKLAPSSDHAMYVMSYLGKYDGDMVVFDDQKIMDQVFYSKGGKVNSLNCIASDLKDIYLLVPKYLDADFKIAYIGDQEFFEFQGILGYSHDILREIPIDFRRNQALLVILDPDKAEVVFRYKNENGESINYIPKLREGAILE